MLVKSDIQLNKKDANILNCVTKDRIDIYITNNKYKKLSLLFYKKNVNMYKYSKIIFNNINVNTNILKIKTIELNIV